jgi:putative transport protein
MKETYVNQATGQVGIGHAVGYPFGVIIVILAMNFLNVVFKFDVEEEKRRYRIEMAAAAAAKTGKEIPTTPFSMISFALVCIVGYLLGSIQIYMGPLGYVSLESTGGVLIGSLILGYIGKIGPFSFRMDSKILAIIRELGLAFFLAIVGLNYGYGAIDAITGSGIQLALVSLIVGFIACMVGFLVGRYGFKLNWVILSGALCGGMTSTPGLGAATEAIGSDEPGAGYGATYPFALLGMVIFAIVLHKLPLL